MKPLLAACLLAAAAQSAFAGVDAKRQELEKVVAELDDTKKEIEAYQRQEEALSQDMRQLKTHNLQAGQKMEELRGRILTAGRKRTELKLRMASLKAVSGSWRSLIASELRRYAMRGAVRSEAFGARKLWAQALARSAVLEKAGLLAQLQGASRKAELAEQETRRRAADLQSRSQKAQAEQKESQLRYQVKQTAFEAAQEKEAAAAKRAKELADSAKALTQMIDRFIKASQSRKTGRAALAIPQNSLDWPVDGTVTASFGREKNPTLGTWVIHQGIHLATAAGARVSAIESGKVIFAGPFRSYGQVVIVDHGSGLYSIYGELGRISAAKGQQVAAGDPIAQAGKSQGRGVLYLELRHGSEALDPLQWLRKK